MAKRFVDMRESDTGYRFAWFDTQLDQFETHNGSQAWDTFSEFVADHGGHDIRVYRDLCPAWAFNSPEDAPMETIIATGDGTSEEVRRFPLKGAKD